MTDKIDICKKNGCQRNNLSEMLGIQDTHIKEIEQRLCDEEKRHNKLKIDLENLIRTVGGCSNHYCPLNLTKGQGTNGACKCHQDSQKMKTLLKGMRSLLTKQY